MPHLIPKGPDDCGDHEWHRSDASTWRCAHCAVGIARQTPWSAAEAAELSLLSLRRTLDLARSRPLSDDDVRTAQRLIGEARAALEQLGPADAPTHQARALLERGLAPTR